MGTYVQGAQNSSGGTGATTIAVTINSVTGGNLLWVAAGCLDSATSVSVADGGNTWNAGPTLANATEPYQIRLFYAMNVTGGNRTVTATFGSSETYRVIYVQERSGLATTGALEGAGTSLRQTTGTTRNAGNYTNSAAGDLVAVCLDYSWLQLPTAGSGFTGRGGMWTFGGEITNMGLPEDASYATGGTRSATWGANNGAITYALQMFLLDAGGGGPVFTPRLTLLGVG